MNHYIRDAHTHIHTHKNAHFQTMKIIIYISLLCDTVIY